LTAKGLIINEGQIVDASFVEVPRQRNTAEENQKIKEGKGDELFNENPHKKRHKDIDARWTKKNNTEKSRFRCRVEHIFGFIENSMNGSYIRCIGFNRAKEIIGLINLTYNFFRYEQVIRLQLLPVKT
jgi:hypothetical protein